MKEQILQLREQGLSYSQIQQQLGCSKGLISYHLGEGQKEKTYQRTKDRRIKQHPYESKLSRFSNSYSGKKIERVSLNTKKQIQTKIQGFVKMNNTKYKSPEFTVEDVINKFGENPECYITGQPIDINQPSTYQFDHKIPRSRGGDNSIDNLGICTRQANISKSDMTPDELIEFCKTVLTNHGYEIS